MAKVLLKSGSNPWLLILFALGVLNAVQADWLNAGVWISIAAGGLACEVAERRHPGVIDSVWRKTQWVSVVVASACVAMMIYSAVS